MLVRSFRDSEAWQASHELTLKVYGVTRQFPREELFGLTSQLRRAASSIAANLAEGYGRHSKPENQALLSNRKRLAARNGVLSPAGQGFGLSGRRHDERLDADDETSRATVGRNRTQPRLSPERLTAHGSRLTAHGSRLTAHGSRLTAHGSRLTNMFPSLISDPPPLVVFELDESGVTAVRRDPRTLDVVARTERDLAPGTLDVSAAHPNIRDIEAVENAVEEILVELGRLPRPEAAVLLPDGASRVTLLDFADLPGSAERLQLIRFRLASRAVRDRFGRIAYRVDKTEQGGRRVACRPSARDSGPVRARAGPSTSGPATWAARY